MATEVSQVRAVPAAKHDAYVEEQLGRARGRIRLLDLSTTLCVFLAGSLAFGLVMVLLDRSVQLPNAARQLAFGFYLVAALAYVGFFVIRPLFRHINPYYAALQVERSIPGAKNSVVNWLDLHGEPLPGAIRTALSLRAAKDLARTSVDQAISGRRAAISGTATFVLVLAAFIVMILVGPPQFFSLLSRALAPFGDGTVPTRTRLTVVQPEGGDLTVPVGRSAGFVVQVDGRVPEPNAPDALKLHFRYQRTDPWEEQLLNRETAREWVTTLAAAQTHNGFWYKITGGDAETDIYRVDVRAAPQTTGYAVKYHFRAYTGWQDEVGTDANLKALRGTEVTLKAQTNRPVKDGRLVMEVAGARKTLPAKVLPLDPNTMVFEFVLDQPGKYRVSFTSAETEAGSDPMSYSLQVIPDYPPQVVLQEPKKKELPVNGQLLAEGAVSDDIGVKQLRLHMKVVDGPALQPQAYREGKSFQLVNGGYPKTLDYKDVVELAQVKDAEGKPFVLQAKMVLEYWLEAADACDFPAANVGESKHHQITLTEPEKNEAKQKEEKRKNQQAKDEHEKKQDQQLQKENEDIQEEAKKKEQDKQNQDKAEGGKRNDEPDPKKDRNAADPQKKDQTDDNKGDQNNDKKPGANKQEKPGDQKEQGEGGKEQQANAAQQQKDKDLIDQAKEKVKKKDQQQNQKGQAKEDRADTPKAENKGDSQPKDGEQKPGECKTCPKGSPSESPSGSKNSGQGGESANQGQGKDGGQSQPNQNKSASKPSAGSPQQAGGSKDMGKPEAPTEKAEGKGGKPQGAEQAAGQPKDGGEKKDQAAAKANGQGGPKSEQQPEAAAKDAKAPMEKGEQKEEATAGGTDNGPKAEAKEEKKQGGDGSAKSGEKPADEKKAEGAGVAKGEQKKDGEKKPGGGADEKGLDAEARKRIEQLAKDAAGGDPQKREEAARKLEEMAKEASDPAVREKAREALDQAKAEALASAKEPPKPADPKDPNSAPPCAECKGGKPGGDSAKPGAGKDDNSGPEGSAKADKKDAGPPKPGQPKPGDLASAKDQGSKEAGKQPGGGNTNSSNPQEAAANQTPAEPEPELGGDPKHLKKAGVLQLQELDELIKRLKKEKPEEHNLTPEEHEAFLRAAQRERDRLAAEAKEVDKTPAARTGGKFGNLRAAPAAAGTPGGPTDTKAAGQIEPPRPLRDAYKEFSRQMSELQREKK